jgi:NifU-like protein involved in Fe-S cluster formation
MKTFTIHLDAVVVLALLAFGLLAFVVYQHREQDQLFKQSMDLSWKLQDAETRIAQLKHKLTNCTAAPAASE